MAAAISCSVKIVENGRKHIGHAESIDIMDSEYPENLPGCFGGGHRVRGS